MLTNQIKIPEIGLGTVQFGLPYGISNTIGQTPEAEVSRILDLAGDRGIRIIDTADDYGSANAVLGRTLAQHRNTHHRIIAKIAIPSNFAGSLASHFRNRMVSILESLRLSSVDTVMLHSPRAFMSPESGVVYESLLALKIDGMAKSIGVSIYSPDQLEPLNRYPVDVVQFPINVFDQRFAGAQISRLKSLGVETHARSIFLQGLLIMPHGVLPPFLSPIAGHIERWHRYLQSEGLTQLEGALQFIKSVEGLDAVIIGVNNSQQLMENIAAWRRTPIKPIDMFSRFAMSNEALVDPSNWPMG